MSSRPAAIRKSDISPALEAAKAAGWDQVTVVVETADGQRFHITAAKADETPSAKGTAFDKWEAGRAS